MKGLALRPPGVDSLVKCKVLGMFLGAPSTPKCSNMWNFTIFNHFHGYVWKSMNFIKVCGFCENGDFAVKGPPETAPGLTITEGFHPGREEATISPKHRHFRYNHLNVLKMRETQ